jgi:predicted peptidase
LIIYSVAVINNLIKYSKYNLTTMTKMAGLIFLLLITSGISIVAFSQDAYERKFMVEDGDTLPYRILLPKNYDAAKKYPLILFLHGVGERGNNNESQLVHGSKLFLRDSIRENYPAIVVFPQCPANSYWSNVDIKVENGKRKFNFSPDGEPTIAMKLLMELLDELEDDYKINSKQRYIGGLSMGGMGTFELVRRKPKYFVAAFPICGGANPETADKLKKINWWIFHGAKDDVVPPEASQQMVDALKAHNANIKFTLYPNANHNSWDSAFAEKDLLPWLFSKHK